MWKIIIYVTAGNIYHLKLIYQNHSEMFCFPPPLLSLYLVFSCKGGLYEQKNVSKKTIPKKSVNTDCCLHWLTYFQFFFFLLCWDFCFVFIFLPREVFLNCSHHSFVFSSDKYAQTVLSPVNFFIIKFVNCQHLYFIPMMNGGIRFQH